MDDPFFGPAFVDVDEWRDAPVRHRYVHGGFEGTDTRFSFYFPPAEQWKGRLLQPLEGGNGGHENTAQAPMGSTAGIAFAAASGCYLVESNQGHIGDDMRILLTEPTVGAYRASAAVRALLVGARRRDVRVRAASRLRARREWRRRPAACCASRRAPTCGRARCPTSWVTPRRGRSASRCRPTLRVCSGPQWSASSTRSSPVATVTRSPVSPPSSAKPSPRCTAPGSPAGPSRRSARRATRARSHRTSPRSRSTTRPTSTTSGRCRGTWAPTVSSRRAWSRRRRRSRGWRPSRSSPPRVIRGAACC